jgi:hypothetical protein
MATAVAISSEPRGGPPLRADKFYVTERSRFEVPAFRLVQGSRITPNALPKSVGDVASRYSAPLITIQPNESGTEWISPLALVASRPGQSNIEGRDVYVEEFWDRQI